jgi:hypothetical protein
MQRYTCFKNFVKSSHNKHLKEDQKDYDTNILLERVNVNKIKLQEDRRRMHNEQILNLYPSPNIMGGIKSKRVG